MKRIVDIGILQSQSGAYAALSQTSRAGALQGVAEVNADPAYDLALRTIERDPEGRLDRYAPLCRDILGQGGVHHIFGCVTSASRKEVIPELERSGGVLWYSAPYEGFEASEHVAYTHSCPNQHLLPLLEWALPALGRRAYLVGSNYIWGWEMAQIARAEVAASGGEILGDRYLAVGDTGLDHILHEIKALKPSFILNSLIGESSYAFLRRLRACAGPEAETPVLSCNFTESELALAGDAAEGLISAGPWFEPQSGQRGSFAEMARQSVHQLARLLHARPGAEALPLAELLALARHDAIKPRLHPEHFHARQSVVIARLQSGRFNEIKHLPEREADPFLTRRDSPRAGVSLKVVS